MAIVTESAAETAGGTLNWLQKTDDQFEEKSMGFRLNAMTGLLAIPGVIIITVAVLAGL